MTYGETSKTCGNILHVHNIAGVASNLAFFQRKLGFEAKVITRIAHPFGYEECSYPQWKMFLALRLFPAADIIHYHGNTWLRRRRLKHFDYSLSKRLHKKIILHFHGRDLRDEHIHLELKEIIDDLRTVLVSTPDLLIMLPPQKAVWLPNPINIEMWHFNPVRDKRTLVVGYYKPPQEEKKGIYFFEHVQSVLKNLKRKGFNFETKPIYWKPHSAMPRYYSSIDVYVDRLGMGWYGLSACEAMASGVPVITYISEDLRRNLPSKEPFLVSPKEKLEENLEMILSDESLRRQLAQKGRKYVLDVHEGLKVAKNLIDIYKRI